MGMDPITIAAGAAIGSAVIGGVSASKASKAQASSANKATKTQADMFNRQVELNQPWQDAGLEALKNYADNPSFQFSYNDMTADPSYKFRLNEGVNAIDASAASRGKLLSGAQDKAIQNYGQNMASQEYGNAYNRALQNYNTNANTDLNIANIGRGAAGQTQNAMQNYANANTNTQMQAGQAQAQGYTNMANTMNTGIGNALYMYNTANQVTPAQQMASFSNNNYTPIGG